MCVDYLRSKNSQISLPDTNHNINILRYQLISGSYSASFGFYAFDPCILKIAVGVPKGVVQVEYCALVSAILRLELLNVVKDFIA